MVRFRKIALLFALASLAVAPVAWAEHDDEIRGRRVDRGNYRLERIQALAHEVDEAARAVNRAAYYGRHHFTWRERRALDRLDELAEAARHFHTQIERYPYATRHTAADYRRLLMAYDRAEDTLYDLHAYRRVLRRFESLGALIDELDQVYLRAGYGPPHGRGHGWGRRR